MVLILWLILAALLLIATELHLRNRGQKHMSQALDNLNAAADAIIAALAAAKQDKGVPEADVQAVADKINAALNPPADQSQS